MANFVAAESITLPVASGTVLAQHRCVNLNSSGQLVHTPDANDYPVGVTLSDSPAGNDLAVPVAIRNGGIVKIQAGGDITAGALVAVEAGGTGQVVQSSTKTDSIGYATEAGADGRIIGVVLCN